jgi:hypothetical protein
MGYALSELLASGTDSDMLLQCTIPLRWDTLALFAVGSTRCRSLHVFLLLVLRLLKLECRH